jgi:hypothetical protein
MLPTFVAGSTPIGFEIIFRFFGGYYRYASALGIPIAFHASKALPLPTPSMVQEDTASAFTPPATASSSLLLAMRYRNFFRFSLIVSSTFICVL